MPNKPRLQDIFEEKRYQKLVLTVSVLLVLLLELLIYVAAAGQSGQKSRIIITDPGGTKVYETQGNTLTSYEKLNFENTFGPIENYRVHIQSESQPFPFRAWLTAAVGVPVGLILLMAFLIRAYLSLLYGDEEDKGREEHLSGAGRFGSLFQFLHRISVFHIGALVVFSVLLLWMVPNFVGDFFTVSVTAIREFKWFFLGVSAFVGLLIVWVIYLRYKLSQKMLDHQFHLEKVRVEKQLPLPEEVPLLSDATNHPQEHQRG